MKKTIKYFFALIIGCIVFTSCDDQYANQTVAEPGGYNQPALQDANFVAAIKTNPVVITKDKLATSLDFITITSVPTLVDSAAIVEYKVILSNTEDFAIYKTIDTKLTGSTLSTTYKQLNDTLKALNPSIAEHNTFARVLAYIVKDGTRALYTTANLPFKVTSYNYPPVAINDITSLPMNGSITISVLTNDTDPEGDVLKVTAVTAPTHGTATISSDGKTVTYTPTTGYSGSDYFSYTVSDGKGNTSTANVDINVLAILSYTSVTPRPYYIIGMANGAWNNSKAGLGVSIYPMSVVSGDKYNLAGDGEFTYTGYFWASRGFKLIRDIGSWDEQWGGSSNNITKPLHNDGGSSDFKVPTDGYYTITLNSITNTFSMVPASVSPTSYAKIGMIGGFNSWGGDVNMTPCESSNNHMWYATYTFPSDTEGKFRANADWGINWGNSTFPVGLGTGGGPNVPIKAGTYTVLFNDISGCYYFIK